MEDMPRRGANASPSLEVVTMRAQRRVPLWMLGLFPLLVTAHGFTQGTDRPGLGPYRDHCAMCHGQDAPVHARRTLKLDGSQVMLKRTGALLDEFLLTHGRADARERQRLIALFQGLLAEEKLR